MAVATKPKPAAKAAKAATVDTHEWFTCEYGKYRIEETRFMLRSVSADGEPLLYAVAERELHEMTPVHLAAQAPDYDGRFDVSRFSGTVGGKL